MDGNSGPPLGGEGRIEVLELLRGELRKRGYVPIVFNFDKPETKDFTETVRLLAGLSKFVIADITNPKSAPLSCKRRSRRLWSRSSRSSSRARNPSSCWGTCSGNMTGSSRPFDIRRSTD